MKILTPLREQFFSALLSPEEHRAVHTALKTRLGLEDPFLEAIDNAIPRTKELKMSWFGLFDGSKDNPVGEAANFFQNGVHYIGCMYVDEEYRGRTLSDLLFAAAIHDLKGKNAKYVQADIEQGNSSSISAAKRNGLDLTGFHRELGRRMMIYSCRLDREDMTP